MGTRRGCALVLLSSLATGAILGCTGDLGGAPRLDGGGGMDAAVTDRDAWIDPTIDSGPPVDAFTPADGGIDPPIDAGPCGATTLAGSITTTTITGAGGGMRATPTSTGGALLAWSGSDVTLQRIDGAGAPFGAAIHVTGDGLWGVAASTDAYAVLVSRSDELLLVVTTTTGTVTHEERLMGAVDHTVTNNEWFGDLLRAGRLDWTGSRWISYSTVQRLWPDGIAHYGDTLRAFTPDGAPSSTYWGWGCSHSIDVRLSHDASGEPTPVCSADCYPGKGVFYAHDTEVFLDASGNCMGYVAQHLGGVAPVAGGSWVGWTSAEGRASQDPAIALVGGSAAAPIWLSSDAADASDMHLSPFEGGLVAAWVEGGSGHIVRLDAAGAPIGAVESIDAGLLSGADDFVPLVGGDVGWATSGRFARLRACM